jgi:hypothetical protein
MKIQALDLTDLHMQSVTKWIGLASLSVAILMISACDSGESSEGIDPGIVEIPIAFIKRPVPLDDMGDEANIDLREPRLFMAGGDVYLRTSSASDATVTNITRSVTTGIGDVKGLNASHDGTKLVFSLRLFDPDPNNPPFQTWDIYEYDMTTEQLRRVISSQLEADKGDDLYPSYLPDGRILFTSNRQKDSQEMQINELRPKFSALDEDENTPALVLHVMNAADGGDIRQISFNQSHDLYPQVLTHYRGGRIVFSRWDNAVGNNEVNIYTANPDGSNMEILYGSQSHATGTGGADIQFTNLREMENGDLMVITRPFDGTFDGGAIEIISVDRFADIDTPIWPLNDPGPAQRRATVSNINNSGSLSLTGRYSSAFPLWDGSNRMLVTKSTCRLDVNNVVRPCIDPYLSDPAAVEKSPAYGIWLYDRDEDTQRPVVLAEDGMVMTDIITIQNRTRAPIIFDKGLVGQLDPDLFSQKVGVVNIKSVYDMGDGTFNGCFFSVCTGAPAISTVQDFSDPANAVAVQRPARFVRFIKPVGIPDPDDPLLVNPPDLDNNAFGPQRNRGMREVVGYAPVEPDGSVKVKVPFNIPLAVEVLDGEGRRIGPRHDNWFQVQRGDTLTCTGCHDPVNGADNIHARSDGELPSINSGLLADGALVNTQLPGSMPPGPYLGSFGQTLAEVRFANVAPVNQPMLSADLIYDDYWTDPAAPGLRAPDASYAYQYADLEASMVSPTNNFCATWDYRCRVTINYAEHIHAIFQLDRDYDDINGVVVFNDPNFDDFRPLAPDNVPPVNDPTNTPLNMDTVMLDGVGDNTCITCHTTANGTQLPYGQLDLTTDPNQDPNNRYRSFQQMFNTRQGRFFDGMNLQIFTIPDGMGGTIPDPAAQIAPIMTTAGARSSFFIEKMTGTELEAGRPIPVGTVDHTNMLTGAELKLISEWIDLGAQNFNNPFDPDAPQN